jgi:hypothetical protein
MNLQSMEKINPSQNPFVMNFEQKNDKQDYSLFTSNPNPNSKPNFELELNRSKKKHFQLREEAGFDVARQFEIQKNLQFSENSDKKIHITNPNPKLGRFHNFSSPEK